MALQLYIGNKNYSSWSMRPWVLMRQLGIEFEEIQLKFGDEGLWGIVWDTNPKLVPDKTIPEGTKVYLASRSKIGE